jgi:hypothetical protein
MRRFLHLIRYIRLLNKNKNVLSNSRINNNPNPLGIQFDWIYRLYTVLNLPFEDKENIDKYGYYYVDNMVKAHVGEINSFLFELGILEYVMLDISSIEQIDQYNIRIVLRFKYLDLKFWAKFFIIFIPILMLCGLLYLL